MLNIFYSFIHFTQKIKFDFLLKLGYNDNKKRFLMIKKLLAFFDNLSFKYKTFILVFIIIGGMFSIALISQLSVFLIKESFDDLFNTRTKSLIKLENIRVIYDIHLQDSIKNLDSKNEKFKHDINSIISIQKKMKNDWKEYKNETLTKDFSITFYIHKFLNDKKSYKKNETYKKDLIDKINLQMKNIENHLNILLKQNSSQNINELNLQIKTIINYFGKLINYDLDQVINEKKNTQKVFKYTLIFSIISIILVFLFSVILSTYIINNFRKLHNSLEQKVHDKTKELTELNDYLKIKISKEVAQSRKKDLIMFQQARLASLGEMLNNIAHQWRQPLGAITMIIQSFQTKMLHGKLSDEFVNTKVKDALLLANNMSQTLEDFKNFFSPNKTKSTFLIKSCIEHSIELSKYSLEVENISVQVKIKANVKLNTYYNELSHVFLNLISNSKDALSLVDGDDKVIQITAFEDKKNAVIQVLDNGGGINDEIVPKIFEPYYTTKYKSAGTGIGLYMSKQIIEKHMNGTIIYKKISHKIANKKRACSLFIIKIPFKEEK